MSASNTGKAVIATVAADRPGIVSELSAIIHGLDLNIEDSRMTVLGGEFAVLMSISGADPALADLEAQLAGQAEAGGFAYLYRRTGERTEAPRERHRVTVEAMDHPGIVRGVTAFFSDRGVNIRELTTQTQRAAHTGAPIFSISMEIEVPAEESTDTLQEAFLAFCEREGLDGALSTD